MRRLEILTCEADNHILELQHGGDAAELLEWLQKKIILDKVRAKLNARLGRTGIG